MKVSHIEVNNFKTFDDISVDLNEFNVFIGACASGKSHFVEILEFLKDFSNYYEDAISQHRDKHLLNYNHWDDGKPCYLKVIFKNREYNENILSIADSKLGFKANEYLLIKFRELQYEVCFYPEEFGFCTFLYENVEFACDFYKLNQNENLEKNLDNLHKIQENKLYLKNIDGKISAKLENEDILNVNDLIPKYILNNVQEEFENENVPIINSNLSSLPIGWNQFFKDIKYYDFNPKFTKFGLLDNTDNYLSEFGGNLSKILSKILNDEDKKRKFINLLNYLLPYIKKVNIGKGTRGKDIFKIEENYHDIAIPSYLVSDGTSNIIALIVALYFENGNIILIEEPERNIHPELLSKLVQMMREVSCKKQIIITTHSPQMLKYIELSDIYFISRDDSGFSTISKPEDNEIIKPFIEELGIDEVFIDNYLGLGND